MIYELTIEVLTPVHIGDAKGRMTSLEFFQDDHAVYMVNEAAWAEILATQGDIDDFVRYVEQETRPSLDRFLDRLPVDRANRLRQETVLRRIPKGERMWVSHLLPFVTDPLSGTPYLPGSSLKGAIRVALLNQLADTPARAKQIVGEGRRVQDGRKTDRPGERLDNLLRASLRGHRRTPQTDWLRGLHVSDAYPEQTACTEVREVRIISLNEGEGYHYGANGARVFVEVVRPGTTFKGRLKCDRELLELLSKTTGQRAPFRLEAWMDACQTMYSRSLEEDKRFFEDAGLPNMVGELDVLTRKSPNLRVGWGSGLLSASVVMHLSNAERQTLRQLYFPRRKHPQFPQSRKVVMAKGVPTFPLGWLRLSVCEARGT